VFPTYVALVPFEENSDIEFSELVKVAAALQIQVVRDFGPLWEVCGAVAPFHSLEEVPPEYIPLAIVNEDLPLDRDGFHFSLGGTPFGLVRYQREQGWSLAASHETLEIICDQSGQRTVPGPSLEQEQGTVDYLVEACDPCEHSTYEINGITVSDFVTPDYYNPSEAPISARLSFTGRITRPREVLGRGYISWRTRLPRPHVYQAFGGELEEEGTTFAEGQTLDTDTQPFDDPKIKEVTGIPPEGKSQPALNERRARAEAGSYPRVEDVPETFGSALRKGIVELLKYIDLRAGQPNPTVAETLAALTDEGSNGENYPETVNSLKEQEALANIFGPDLFDPALALWMCMHIA
jgi:hypothetical protein